MAQLLKALISAFQFGKAIALNVIISKILSVFGFFGVFKHIDFYVNNE